MRIFGSSVCRGVFKRTDKFYNSLRELSQAMHINHRSVKIVARGPIELLTTSGCTVFNFNCRYQIVEFTESAFNSLVMEFDLRRVDKVARGLREISTLVLGALIIY